MNAATVFADIATTVAAAGLKYKRSHEVFDLEGFANLSDRAFQVDPGDFLRERATRDCVNYTREVVVTIVFAIRERDQFITLRDTMLAEEEIVTNSLELLSFVQALSGGYSQTPDGKWILMQLTINTDYEVAV